MARSGWAYTDLRYFKNLGGPTGSVQFLVSETQLSGSQYFVYSTASNNIGIGLTTWDGVGDMDVGRGLPHSSHKVHIVGDVSVTGSIYADNYIIKNVSTIESDGDSKFGDSSADYHAFTGSISVSEKVGIGTSTPAKHLHLYGSSGEVELRLGSNDKFSSVVQKSNAELIIQNASGGDILFYDDSAETMRIKDGGNVGIGVGDPDSALEILSTSTQLKISYDSDSYATLAVASDSALTIASAESGDITLDPGGSDVIADGNFLPNADSTRSLGSASKRWANIYTGDLHLKNDRGDWTVVEEADYLSVINNATGKRYRLMMEEIED